MPFIGEELKGEKEKYNWDRFVEYASQAGIDLEYEEDYESWWACWKASRDSNKGGDV